MNSILNYCIDYLTKKNVQMSQCVLINQNLIEMGSEIDDITLLRSNHSNSLNIQAIKDNKRGTISTNDLSNEELNKTLNKLVELTESSEKDKDYSISPYQESNVFSKGKNEPNLNKMYDLLDKLIRDINNEYPMISLNSISLVFRQIEKFFLNSNNTYFESYKGVYDFNIVFMAKDQEKISSFNYTGTSFETLPDDLLSYGNLRDILKQTTKLLNPIAVPNKFIGEVIITPQCMSDIINMFSRLGLQDSAIYTKTSKIEDKLNQKVASSKLTLHCNPVSNDISDGYFITQDGYPAENLTIINDGILKSFLLSDYGARKANMERSKNTGRCFVIESGDGCLNDMIKNVDKGLFIARLSFGMPAANGDFSGIAKNSFYIEDGAIKHAVNETMIYSNIYKMLMDIKEVSKNRVNLGSAIYPWIKISDITISGK